MLLQRSSAGRVGDPGHICKYIEEAPRATNVDIKYLKCELGQGNLANELEGRRFKDEAKNGRHSLLVETFALSGEGKSISF